MLQIGKMFIFSLWGSGDVQPWDSYTGDDDRNGCSEVRFILPGDDSDDYLEDESSYSSDSDGFYQ